MAFCLVAYVLSVTAAAAEQPVSRICSASRVATAEGQIECINFISGFQAAKGWQCRVFDWSDYLRTEMLPAIWTTMGGLIPILESTAGAFCDRGVALN